MTSRHDRPNVLLICTDHWPAALTRPAGHPVVMTPTLAQLASCGVWFENAYSATPTCVPARRSLMTGLSARGHGDRVFSTRMTMPDVPTLAQSFRNAGYQAYAVGKLHVYPQRDRIGFDDVILNEEGRNQFGLTADDWELYLADQGYAGQGYASGLCNNDYLTRTWHLPEHCHPTNWAVSQMCRTIARRDPTRPAFWYLSFVGPHPPVWPLQAYMDLYRDVEIDPPVIGEWARDPQRLPYALRRHGVTGIADAPEHEVELGRRAFYATLTHIDHQIRVVIGTLRERGLLDNTIIAFTSDHGDMLGDHGRWAKRVMYDRSANVPLLVVPAVGDDRLKPGTRDTRLAELRDVMPTLLDLAGLPIPDHVEGQSLVGSSRRPYLYGEHNEDARATRMIRDERFKLIYYPVGNVVQLFDMVEDPRECHDLAGNAEHRSVRDCLTEQLIANLYGDDLNWVKDGRLVGLPDQQVKPIADRGLHGQRGRRFM